MAAFHEEIKLEKTLTSKFNNIIGVMRVFV